MSHKVFPNRWLPMVATFLTIKNGRLFWVFYWISPIAQRHVCSKLAFPWCAKRLSCCSDYYLTTRRLICWKIIRASAKLTTEKAVKVAWHAFSYLSVLFLQTRRIRIRKAMTILPAPNRGLESPAGWSPAAAYTALFPMSRLCQLISTTYTTSSLYLYHIRDFMANEPKDPLKKELSSHK